MPHVRPRLVVPLLLTALLALTGCSSQQGTDADPDQVDSVSTPELGACRLLTADDVDAPSNATRVVDCTAEHTAQTYAVGELPASMADAAYDGAEVAAWAYDTCSTKFQKFVGGDDSRVMRSVLSWAWFRPSEQAWDDGARWYRCDVVGGGEQIKQYVALPADTRGLLLGQPADEWMVCAQGPTVAGSVKVPCTDEHTWRAISTIKLGEPDDPYPGDRVSEVRTRDYCSDQVGAWLGYRSVDYEFGYSWFNEADWGAGNRRSVCWAKTSQ